MFRSSQRWPRTSRTATTSRYARARLISRTRVRTGALWAGLEQTRRWGRILNVASVVGYQPGGPGMAAYYATKPYVLSFSKGLARELRGTGVSVTVVCPGPTKTAFEEKSGARQAFLYRWVSAMAPDAVARAAYRGMKRQSSVVIPGLLAKVLAVAGELPPRGIALEINRRMLQRA